MGFFHGTKSLRSRSATEDMQTLQADTLGESDGNGVQPEFGRWLVHLHDCEFPDLCRVR